MTKGLSEINSKAGKRAAVGYGWSFEGKQIGTFAEFRELEEEEFALKT